MTFLLLLSLLVGAPGAQDSWTDFRGPAGDGNVPGARVPLTWSEDENVRWRTDLPGRGWSSPVVVGGRAWMTTADPEGTRLSVLAVELEGGELVLERELFAVDEPQHRNKLNSFASPSPAVGDGRLFVTFGYGGTAALDLDTGETLWARQDLVVDHMEGPGSTPVCFEDLLLLHFDGGDRQFVVALEAATGATRWLRERSFDFEGEEIPPDRRKAYSTPLVLERDGEPLLVSTGAEATYGYDPYTGEELWRLDHGGFSMASRPFEAHGQVYVSTGFMRPELLALQLEDRDRTPGVRWTWSKGVPTMPSAVALGGDLWFVSDGGVATCLDPSSGEERWKGRVGGDMSASPLALGGRVFFFDRAGLTTVVEPGDTPRIVAENRLEDGCMATPAVLGDALILRTRTRLYRIEAPAGG